MEEGEAGPCGNRHKKYASCCSLLLEYFAVTDFPSPLESLPEGTRNPEQGVEAKKGERPEQQPGHGPEGVVQVRIFFLVMVGGMGQIAGEFAV